MGLFRESVGAGEGSVGVQPVPFGEIDEHATQVMVPMRDGVRLATDVYLPPHAERLASVLVRLPYDKTGTFSFMPIVAQRFVERGYAAVIQDVRGKVRSEGETVAFVHEVADGWDTLEWIASQRWSNGAVGMFGDSYYGFTQWAAAVSGHPALRAIVPRNTTSHIGDDWMYRQGVFCLSTMGGWGAQTWVGPELYETEVDWSVRPLAELAPASINGRRSASLDRWMREPPGSAYWTEGIFGRSSPLEAVRIPALHVGGWYDVFQRGQIEDFRQTSAHAPLQYLRMDAADHFDDELIEDGRPIPDFYESEDVLLSFLPHYLDPAFEFLDRHLRELDGPSIPPVSWMLANDGWRRAESWPPPGTVQVSRFPVDARRAHEGPDGGALADRPDRASGSVRWIHDPEHLVPWSMDPWRPLLGLIDERAVEARDDVITFTSEPAPEPLDLAGPATAHLAIGAGSGSTHVMAKLVDVYPSGRARLILDGAALVHDPDPASTVPVDLGHTGYRLRPGHRLRLEVASSAFPRYLPHPGTDEDPWLASRPVAIQQELRLGGAAPSRLELTILPS